MRRSWDVLFFALTALAVLLGLSYVLWLRWRTPRESLIGARTEAGWLTDLRSPDASVGARAADELAGLGDVGLPVLMAARKDADLRAHRQAVRGLVKLGSKAAPALVEALPAGGERAATALVRIGPEAVPALVQRLRDPEKAAPVTRVLAGMGPRARPAMSALMAALQDRQGKAEVRAEAARALGLIGPENSKGGGEVFDPLPVALASALEDSSSAVRVKAAQALEQIGRPARLAVPSLVRATRDSDPGVAGAACRALGRMDDPAAVRELAARVLSGAEEVRLSAAEALVRLGPLARPAVPLLVPGLLDPDTAPAVRGVLRRLGPDAVAGLTRALSDTNPLLRREIALELASLGSWARAAVPELQATLKDVHPEVALAGTVVLNGGSGAPLATVAACGLHEAIQGDAARAVAIALASIDPKAAGHALPVLVASLQTTSFLRWESALALGGLATDGGPAVPALIALLEKEPTSTAQALAARALYRMKPSEEVEPTLRRLLRKALPEKGTAVSGSLQVPIGCILILGRLGPGAAPAVPDLRKALQVPALRPYAALALARIDRSSADECVQGLAADLDETNPAARSAALAALLDIGPPAREALPALRGILRDPELVSEGLEVVANVGPAGALLVPDLIGLLSDRNRRVAERAGEVLAGLGAAGVPGLTGALNSPNPTLRAGAARVLGQLGSVGRSAVPSLLAALDDADPGVRLSAAEALGGIGPAAAPAVEALRGWLSHFETDDRRQAALALGRIGPEAVSAAADLVSCLFDPDEVVRYGAARALGRIAPPRNPVRTDLEGALLDLSEAVRLAVAESLGRLDPESKRRTGEMLVALAEGPSVRLRREAVTALAEIDPERRKELLPLLFADLRAGSVDGILGFGSVARLDPERLPECRARLLAAVNGPDEAAAGAAAKVIGDLGEEARPLLPELERWPARSSDLALRRAVTAAVRKIDPARVPEGQTLHPPDPWGG
jgi:HEAT repeat protein